MCGRGAWHSKQPVQEPHPHPSCLNSENRVEVLGDFWQLGLQEAFDYPGPWAELERAAGVWVPSPSYLHVGPDLSLAPCTVWDETLASQGRGAGVAPVERMEPNYRPVCHLLWEKVERGRGTRGGHGKEGGGGARPLARRRESQHPKEDCQRETPALGLSHVERVIQLPGWGRGHCLDCDPGSSLTLRPAAT